MVDKITSPITPLGEIDKINEVIDEVDKKLENTATGTNALTVGGTATNQIGATNIGLSSSVTGSNTSTTKSRYSIAIGNGASISDKEYSIAIGGSVRLQDAFGGIGAEYKSIAIGGSTTKDKAIQLGYGTNSTENSFFVGLGNNNYQLLNGTNGLIPDARLSSNIARTSAIPTVNNATLTITQGGTTKGTFTANASSNVTIDLDADGGTSRNIGEIVASTLPLTDAGLHLLDGSLIQGNGIYSAFVTYIAGLVSTYPDLFETEANWQTAVTNYGVCGKFVYDSTNNTVRLPKITGIVEGTTDLTALGDLVEAGLPNITGTIRYGLKNSSGADGGQGALYKYSDDGSSGITISTSGTNKGFLIGLDASRSSSIYGNSSTVQPQTIKVLYYIVIATSTKTEIQVDIDEIATDLNGKADRDGSNMVNSVKNFDGNWVNFNQLVTLSTAKAVGEYTLDLSPYLPNDNYNYDVKILFYCYSSASGEYHYTFYNDIFPQVSTSWGYINVNARTNTMCFDIPVSNQRYIIYKVTQTAANDVYVRAVGYRRIGTNQ